MKILAISLLRLGDVLIHLPAIQALRHKHPESEIHLLMNQQFQALVPLLKGVDKIHFFDRQGIQNALADGRFSIVHSYAQLKGQIDTLNQEEFTKVVNLTHNRLSAFVGSRIQCQSYEGLLCEKGHFRLSGSQWWRELSNHSRSESLFTFSQVLTQAQGEGVDRLPELNRTEAGIQEAKAYTKKTRRRILIQALTSDSKKDISLALTRGLIEQLDAAIEDLEILLLCAPSEAERLESLCHDLSEDGIFVQLAPVSLAGALSLLDESDLLISADTSIKHLALATQCPVIELAFGSSSPTETGALKPGSFIVQGIELCTPCAHSDACYRERRFCAERIGPKAITELSLAVLSQNQQSLLELAERGRRNFRVFGTILSGEIYHRYQLSMGHFESCREYWDRRVWNAFNSTKLVNSESAEAGSAELIDLAQRLGLKSTDLVQLGDGLIEEAEALEIEAVRSADQIFHLRLSLSATQSKEKLYVDELSSILSPILGMSDSGGYLRHLKQFLAGLKQVRNSDLKKIRQELLNVQVLCRLRKESLSSIVQAGRSPSVGF